MMSFLFSVVIPLWLVLLGPIYMSGEQMIPFIDLAVFSLIPITPILAGIGIRKCTSITDRSRTRHRVMDFAVKSLRPFSALFLVFCIVYTLVVEYDLMRDISHMWKFIIAAISLPWFGGLLSCAVASVLKLNTAQAKAIAMEMVNVNTALAIILLKNTLSQPEADIASLAPSMSFVVSSLPLFLIGIFDVARQVPGLTAETSRASDPENLTVSSDQDPRLDEPELDEQHELQKLAPEST